MKTDKIRNRLILSVRESFTGNFIGRIIHPLLRLMPTLAFNFVEFITKLLALALDLKSDNIMLLVAKIKSLMD